MIQEPVSAQEKPLIPSRTKAVDGEELPNCN